MKAETLVERLRALLEQAGPMDPHALAAAVGHSVATVVATMDRCGDFSRRAPGDLSHCWWWALDLMGLPRLPEPKFQAFQYRPDPQRIGTYAGPIKRRARQDHLFAALDRLGQGTIKDLAATAGINYALMYQQVVRHLGQLRVVRDGQRIVSVSRGP